MRLDALTLRNYRRFEKLTIDFHPQLTVLIAPNGAGKTTVLDAARVALWPYVKGFDLGSQTGKKAIVQLDDVRLFRQESGNMEPQVPCVIEAIGCILPSYQSLTWSQTRERMKPGTDTLGDRVTKDITAVGKKMQAGVRTPVSAEPLILPLVTYLGTSRLWYEGRFTSQAEDIALDNSAYSRTSGYLNCLSYSSSFKAFMAWYGWVYRSYREQQIEALEKNSELSELGQRFAYAIQVVKSAVDALVKSATGWHSLEYSASHNQKLVMSHDTLGTMPVDMLSDGLRNTIAMVADLAFRAYKLNPHLGAAAAQQTPGVALIDEVDMFLHPSWQQSILQSLCAAFPKIQLIVTTHSPQVLTTVPRENIRVLDQDEHGCMHARTPDFSPLAHESGDALAKIMGTHREPPLALQDKIRHYEQLVRIGQEQSDEAQTLRTALDKAGYQFHESDLTTWRFLASRNAGRNTGRTD